MSYVPHTENDIKEMLASIGVQNIDELFACIPEVLRLKRELNLPTVLSEADLTAHFDELEKRNMGASSVFLGAGAYRHYVPAIVSALALRGEFSTSYTPYQPEVSQGTLQAIFEFQTMFAMLTGMDVANASMYDGASALAEAVLMARRINKRKRVLISQATHPEYRQVIQTYCPGDVIEWVEIPYDRESGQTDLNVLREKMDNETCAVVLQSPNFFGTIEEYEGLDQDIKKCGALLIVNVVPALSMALLKSPGERGADIVCGEGQSLGLPVSYGGPYVGFFAVRKEYLRQMPGRLCGETRDREGRRAFALTLSTREQHIRREKATSNICTNQGLCALSVAIYMTAMGKQGLRDLAILNLRKADYLKNQLAKLEGYEIRFSSNTFNEFVLRCRGKAGDVRATLLTDGIVAGLPLGEYYPELDDSLLLCVTELNSREEIDRLVDRLAAI
ncbi:MAG: aminomethyl-transferring glycine dehydrogenase [Nitrospinae bacterium CG11_big_fil_rev_8_21_14_0_20_45_15]|nr:MAG: aminomethyl-transferring glycine dehydrogenase [Nitrospinae bacterium CG11_big_fil_rev_8_21_14_0_20_45_15]